MIHPPWIIPGVTTFDTQTYLGSCRIQSLREGGVHSVFGGELRIQLPEVHYVRFQPIRLLALSCTLRSFREGDTRGVAHAAQEQLPCILFLGEHWAMVNRYFTAMREL